MATACPHNSGVANATSLGGNGAENDYISFTEFLMPNLLGSDYVADSVVERR